MFVGEVREDDQTVLHVSEVTEDGPQEGTEDPDGVTSGTDSVRPNKQDVEVRPGLDSGGDVVTMVLRLQQELHGLQDVCQVCDQMSLYNEMETLE